MNQIDFSICESIADNSPFSETDVFNAYLKLNSWDLVIRAIELASQTGSRNILAAHEYSQREQDNESLAQWLSL